MYHIYIPNMSQRCWNMPSKCPQKDSQMFLRWCKYVLEISQMFYQNVVNCLRYVTNMSHKCPTNTHKWSSRCPQYIYKMSPKWPQDVPKISQRCLQMYPICHYSSHWCPRWTQDVLCMCELQMWPSTKMRLGLSAPGVSGDSSNSKKAPAQELVYY